MISLASEEAALSSGQGSELSKGQHPERQFNPKVEGSNPQEDSTSNSVLSGRTNKLNYATKSIIQLIGRILQL